MGANSTGWRAERAFGVMIGLGLCLTCGIMDAGLVWAQGNAAESVGTAAGAAAETGMDSGSGSEADSAAGSDSEADSGSEADSAAGSGAETDSAAAEAGMEAGIKAGDEEARPWAVGISPAQQARAQALYAAGNALLYDFLLAEAVDKYREALHHWKHPGIYYNLARALYYLGRPLDAYESILEALRYGPDALQPREHAQAIDFKAELEQRLAWLEVRCDQPDMDITLDGQSLLAGPGIARRHLLPGEHLLVIMRSGSQPVSRRLLLEAGEHETLSLWSQQRWPGWQPWTVLGTGAGVGLAGALLQWRASANFDRFRDEFTSQCPDGCKDTEVPALSALHTRAVWQNRIGVSAMIAGSAVALGGAIMIVLNRSQPIRVRLGNQDRQRARLIIAPALSTASLGAMATLPF